MKRELLSKIVIGFIGGFLILNCGGSDNDDNNDNNDGTKFVCETNYKLLDSRDNSYVTSNVKYYIDGDISYNCTEDEYTFNNEIKITGINVKEEVDGTIFKIGDKFLDKNEDMQVNVTSDYKTTTYKTVSTEPTLNYDCKEIVDLSFPQTITDSYDLEDLLYFEDYMSSTTCPDDFYEDEDKQLFYDVGTVSKATYEITDNNGKKHIIKVERTFLKN